MTQAYLGSQTHLKLGDGGSPESFADIASVVSIDPVGVKKDLVETTDLLSLAKEFIGGLSDGQPVNFTCNFVPNDTQQLALIAAANTTSTAKNFKYIYPSTAAGGTKMFTFAAVVLGMQFGPTTPNTAVQITFNLKISGAITGPIAVA